jgi:predicted Fe-Mo cluster-binding NifX family protein
MDLIFAFALNNNNQFETCHFGDSEKFAIYHQEANEIKYKYEIENIYRSGAHGDNKKGNSIIEYLKKHNINTLVSRQFGQNIVMVNKHFIPIIITKESPDEVIKILQKNLHWILDEWNGSSSEFKLFKIKSSVLKLKIED